MNTAELEILIARILNGDLEALEGLYRDFHHAVFSYSLLLLHDRAQAEDNAQDVFLRIWDKASTYQAGRNPQAWIMGITRNAALDRLRRSAREIGLDDLPDDVPADEPPADLLTAEQVDLWRALLTLDLRDRQIVLLKAVAELPAKSVGRLVNLPPSTVHWRYRRSLRKLADLIGGNRP